MCVWGRVMRWAYMLQECLWLGWIDAHSAVNVGATGRDWSFSGALVKDF